MESAYLLDFHIPGLVLAQLSRSWPHAQNNNINIELITWSFRSFKPLKQTLTSVIGIQLIKKNQADILCRVTAH